MQKSMDIELEVVGRHALLFDDDAMAAFVNSNDALVEWNSIPIDRYDVRHLLSSPPPSRHRRNPRQHADSPDSIETDLDYERYLDLLYDQQESDDNSKPVDAGGYNAVAFSYGNNEDFSDQKNLEFELGSPRFRPPFPVPENLLVAYHVIVFRCSEQGWSSCDLRLPFTGTLFPFVISKGHAGGIRIIEFFITFIRKSHHIYLRACGMRSIFIEFCYLMVMVIQIYPPTEKLHQIIVRTAMFVSKYGGQSEIILRVKQGDNPTFGFLMPDHQLHSYFRFLVDHREVLNSDDEGKPQNEKISDTEPVGGALSLLGSLYGSGEDEDASAEFALTSKENLSKEAVDASAPVAHISEKIASPKSTSVKDAAVSNHLLMSKDKAPAFRRNSFINGLQAGSASSTRKEGESFGSLSAATDKLRASSMPAISKIEPLFVEPPSEMKKLVSKIVEFIIKNGKQFEAVLIEQDCDHGRFPFLLPSNQYNPYYLKVLQEAQKSKVSGKSSLNEKDGSLSLESAGCDIPYDSDRKEKFKMVICKSKNDGQDPPPKASQQQFGVGVDAAAAAAILQAATRGIWNPNLGFLSRSSLNGTSRDHSSEGGQVSGLGSFPSERSSVPVAKEIAKTGALEAASEADSYEAHLTREQKLKAERLRRAKMFVAMIKSGSAPLKPEPSRGLSVEPQGSNVFGAVAEDNIAAKAREGSSAPSEIDTSEKIESSGKKHSADEYNERMSRRKYRSRSSKHEEAEDVDDDEDEVVHKHSRKKHRSHRSSLEDDNKEEKDEEERDNKHSRKKHRLHRSSHSDELEDERDRKYSRKLHRSHRSSHEEDEQDEEEHDHRHSRKKHGSHCSSHHSRDGHKHRKILSSSRDRKSRHGHKLDISSDEEHLDRIRSDKHGKRSQSDREELEEGEISSKVSDQSRGSVGGGGANRRREASVDLSSSYQEPSEPTEVSDDLRAKIRAMLMGTL